MPQRIQRRRTAGWRLPEGAVIVTRPTKWGNPWREGDTGWTTLPGGYINREPHPPLTREQAIESFRNSWSCYLERVEEIRCELAGKDLACWCPLDKPCHADVLLAIANGWLATTNADGRHEVHGPRGEVLPCRSEAEARTHADRLNEAEERDAAEQDGGLRT